ncbi:protein FAF-like, chloroplastic [Sesamum alatum]|uniref:Protein FAF-like, chloroplastic n=1 Tax=Sesamum alatum TaxID=300844 RepID=A0AAE1Z1R4_9LAMI|nr:protein FAF-like, chloroplastic [Sesamum alatum]
MSPNRLIPSPPVKVVDEQVPMKQGIVTILGSDCERSKAKSIRRTLSADMSSKKWLQQNGFFSPVKKMISCSSSSSSSSSSESEEEYEKIPGQDDVWRSIQAEKERNEGRKTAEIGVVWSSILTQKSESSCLPPPYVHPLVKRSASSLSEKSLEICTESLGSETGSDCFSSYTLSDGDEERVVREEDCSKELNPFPGSHVAKYKKSPARSFPPPLPSIAGGDGASLHMQAHRENGRLVVEAVSVPPRNNFHAQRRDGRLVLTLIHTTTPSSKENSVQEFEKVFDNMEEVDEDVPPEEERFDDGGLEEEYAAEEKFVVEQNSRSLPNGMISVHKTGLVMKKLMAIGNKNPTTWSKNFNQDDDQVMTEEFPIPQSLPPPPRVARLIPPPTPPAAASFNVYEYFWRNKTTTSDGGSFITTPQPTHLKNKHLNTTIAAAKVAENQELVEIKGNKTEYFVPYIRGCKESRRSLLIWEPYCIATS